MTVQAPPHETLGYPPARASELEIELLPHRLCISYAADDCQSVSLSPGEYQLIHRMLVESGHIELAGGIGA